MSLFNLPVERKPKPEIVHPWAKTIKDAYAHRIKTAHNDVGNVVYPKPKRGRVPRKNRFRFTVIGIRTTKEFIYCVNLVKGMHKYRWKNFAAPVIRGVTGVEWQHVLNELKQEYGGLAFCIQSQVAVLCNEQFLGGEKELKELVEINYVYHLTIDYEKESEAMFINFVKASGRSCAYFHICIGDKPIGTLIFMLYTDIVPNTCENFLRLCKKKKGGYGCTPVHRIVKDSFIQCGGFGLKDTPMDCENFIIPHDRRGVLGMANDGRHKDCSTQFYVLLQPNDWMNYRYVAFGQLIEGENTLREIEKQSTFYESPVSAITISKAGLLNLDCKSMYVDKGGDEMKGKPLHKTAEGRDIPYHTGVYEFIQGHIEDLVSVGELFSKMLMEHVFLEIEFRYLTSLEMPKGEGEEQEKEREAIQQSNLHHTERFIRKKEEIQHKLSKNLDKTVVEKRVSYASYAASNRSKKDEVNNDFDVEDYWYEFEGEEYQYPQVEPAAPGTPKPVKPFYIPLTDVPYPGEVDSIFDLKRLFQGDYCLESDLNPNQPFTTKADTRKMDKISAISEIMTSYQHDESSEEEEQSASDMDTDEEKEVAKYLAANGERVSFSGTAIKRIARDFNKRNPLGDKPDEELFTDEDIRRLKLANQDLKAREVKKVSISVEPWETHMQIKRRQTGFVKPCDLSKLKRFQQEEESDEEDDEDDDGDDGDADDDGGGDDDDDNDRDGDSDEDYEDMKANLDDRKVSISASEPTESKQHQIKRRQTGFVRPADLKKMHLDDEEEEDEDKVSEEIRMGKVRITEHPNVSQGHKSSLKGSLRRKSMDDEDEEDKTRPSVLVRLYDDVGIDDDEIVPTLKDYIPPQENKKKNVMLTMSPARDLISIDSVHKDNDLFRKDHYLRPSAAGSGSTDQILTLHHSKKAPRRISTDYVKSMDQSDRRQEKSLRTMEFGRKRPSLTISQYQMKNQMQRVEEKKKSEAVQEQAKAPIITPKLGPKK